MTYHKVLQQKMVSPDGKIMAKAISSVTTSDNDKTKVLQNVLAKVTINGSSSCSTSSSRSRAD